MGPGRWNAEALARELEVSPRTVHRIMATLSMANIPWYFCKDTECYRVRDGFRFPGLEPNRKGQTNIAPDEVLTTARNVLGDLEKLADSLRLLCLMLEKEASGAES